MINQTAAWHVKRYDAEKSARAQLEAYWQELAYYCLPRKAFITRFQNTGDRMPTDLFDNTAINAVDYLAAGIQGYLTNPNTRWFGFSLQNKDMLKISGSRDYLRGCEDVVNDLLSGSNFYQENCESYRNLGVFGQPVFFIGDDTESTVRFEDIPLETAVFFEDSQRRVNAVYFIIEFTAEQARDKFGELKLNRKITKALEEGDIQTKFKFLFCCYPRPVFDPGKKDSRNMPYAADWIDYEFKATMREGGYNEFPFAVPRWARWGRDKYGASPAMNELPNIETLNAMCRTNLISGEKISDPPLDIPDEAFLRPFDFNAGGINIRNTGFQGEKINVLSTGGNIPFALDYEDARRSMIQRAFFNDLFMVLSNQRDKTAEEVRQMVAERMLLLGPAIGHIVNDYIRPTIRRVLNIAARARRLPPIPEALSGQPYIIEVTSPLARAQRQTEISGLQMSMAIISQFAAVVPETLDKINFDEAVDITAEITGLNPRCIRDDDEVQQIRDNRAQLQQQAAQLEALQAGANIVKTGTEADKNIAQGATVGAAK